MGEVSIFTHGKEIGDLVHFHCEAPPIISIVKIYRYIEA